MLSDWMWNCEKVEPDRLVYTTSSTSTGIFPSMSETFDIYELRSGEEFEFRPVNQKEFNKAMEEILFPKRAYHCPKVNFDSLIKKVIFNGPATIVIWSDGTKTVVKCMDTDTYDQEKGLMMAIMEKLLGGTKGDVKRFFKKHIPKEEHACLYDEDLKEVISSMMNSIFTFGFHKEEDEEDE